MIANAPAADSSTLPRGVARAQRIALGRSLLLPFLAAGALGFTTWHVVRSSPTRPQTEPVMEPPRSPFANVVAGVGLIEPQSENIEVAAIVPGTVVEVAVKVGDEVAAGDLLFRLDDRQQKAQLAVQQAQLEEARATLQRWEDMPRHEDLAPSAARIRRAEAEVARFEDQLRRAQQLAGRRVITDEEQVEREQAYNAALARLSEAQAEDERLRAGAWEADLVVARSQVDRSRQLVEQAQVEVDRLAVRAPIRGTVLKVDVRPGEYVGAPSTQPLIVLGDVATLHVRVDVNEHDLPRFQPGMPGRGYVRGDAETPLTLAFVRIEPFTEPKRSLTGAGNERIDTRVLQVVYAIESTPRPVYVGQQIDVFLNGATKAAEK